jgi:FkbM family methyltransferase
MTRRDVVGGLIRVTYEMRPTLGARLAWMREWWRGNHALRVVKALVQRGDTVVDIGANAGFFAANLARFVGPTGQVHAVEPDPSQRMGLEAIRARRGNVTLHFVALSDREGDGTLHVPVVAGEPLGALASLSIPEGRAAIAHQQVRVPLTSLDSLLPSSAPPVAFVKCDVEGHELAVLRGGDSLLRRDRPAILVEIEQRHQETDIQHTFDYLAGLGYVGYALRIGGLRPIAEFNVHRDQLGLLPQSFVTEASAIPRGYVNDFVFVRPGVDVTQLLASQP